MTTPTPASLAEAREIVGASDGLRFAHDDCQRKHEDRIALALDRRDATAREALEWYGSRAADLRRYGASKEQAGAMEAVIVELITDGGKRAAQARGEVGG